MLRARVSRRGGACSGVRLESARVSGALRRLRLGFALVDAGAETNRLRGLRQRSRTTETGTANPFPPFFAPPKIIATTPPSRSTARPAALTRLDLAPERDDAARPDAAAVGTGVDHGSRRARGCGDPHESAVAGVPPRRGTAHDGDDLPVPPQGDRTRGRARAGPAGREGGHPPWRTSGRSRRRGRSARTRPGRRTARIAPGGRRRSPSAGAARAASPRRGRSGRRSPRRTHPVAPDGHRPDLVGQHDGVGRQGRTCRSQSRTRPSRSPVTRSRPSDRHKGRRRASGPEHRPDGRSACRAGRPPRGRRRRESSRRAREGQVEDELDRIESHVPGLERAAVPETQVDLVAAQAPRSSRTQAPRRRGRSRSHRPCPGAPGGARRRPLARSQTRTRPSLQPVARARPSGRKARLNTSSGCGSGSRTGLPVAVSKSRTRPWAQPVAAIRPSSCSRDASHAPRMREVRDRPGPGPVEPPEAGPVGGRRRPRPAGASRPG